MQRFFNKNILQSIKIQPEKVHPKPHFALPIYFLRLFSIKLII